MSVIAIHQPNFFPWLGYFSKIQQADKFVFLDNVQLAKKGGYTYRVQINEQGNAKWMALPLKRGSGVHLINEIEILDNRNKDKLFKTIEMNYSKAKYFKEYRDLVYDMVICKNMILSEYNIYHLSRLIELFGLNTAIYRSSEILIDGQATERLLNIIKTLEGDVYISGFGGDKYQEKNIFDLNNINLTYSTFRVKSYPQFKNQFIPGLSILDALFHIGVQGIRDTL